MTATARPRRTSLAVLLLVGTTLAALTGCSGAAPGSSSGTGTGSPGTARAASAGWTRVSPARIRPGDRVPVPRGRVVLTLRGVPNTNVGRTLQLDLATLDRMGTVSYTVFDRQAEGRHVSFSGPLLSTLLDVAGATGTTLHAAALNDYAVDIPSSDATELPVVLATRADGKRMTVAHYGPTRLVYPTAGHHLDETVYDPRWIWQLSSITVR